MSSKIRHYPKLWGISYAEPPNWVSQYQAADELNINTFRIGLLITHDHLEPLDNISLGMGVSRQSLEKEKAWRKDTDKMHKFIRVIKDCIKSL